MKLDRDAAVRAIEQHVAGPLGMPVEEAAAGMYRVINTNMAQGVREISIKRGIDPREFPLVAAGGAGPLHACMICEELEIPLLVVPRESSIFCAAGMLASDLQHDFVASFVATLDGLDWAALNGVIDGMLAQGAALLAEEGIPEPDRVYAVKLDCRYVKQYHEVSFPVDRETVRRGDAAAIAAPFHVEHRRMYGYALDDEAVPVELINVRVRAVGVTRKPDFPVEPNAGPDAAAALKGRRRAWSAPAGAPQELPVYDGHRTRHGNFIRGPAVIEQVNTTLLLTDAYDCVCDPAGSFVAYRRGRADRLPAALKELVP
jgi:N-methylhydantoinase A